MNVTVMESGGVFVGFLGPFFFANFLTDDVLTQIDYYAFTSSRNFGSI